MGQRARIEQGGEGVEKVPEGDEMFDEESSKEEGDFEVEFALRLSLSLQR